MNEVSESVSGIVAAIRALPKEERHVLWREWKRVELADLCAQLGEGHPPCELEPYDPDDRRREATLTVRVKGFRHGVSMKQKLRSWLHGVADEVFIEVKE